MKRLHQHFLYSFFSCAFFLVSTSYAQSFDSIGLNLYQDIHNGTISSTATFQQQALPGTQQRFDIHASEWKQRVCPTCSTILGRDIDISDISTLQGSDIPLGLILRKYLNDELQASPISNIELEILSDLLSTFVEGVETEVKEQQDTYADQKFLGWYYDGDEENSGFDLLSDTSNIYKIFYDDVEDFEKKQDTVGDE